MKLGETRVDVAEAMERVQQRVGTNPHIRRSPSPDHISLKKGVNTDQLCDAIQLTWCTGSLSYSHQPSHYTAIYCSCRCVLSCASVYNRDRAHLLQQDIRQLDFTALKRAGYRGAVFDKDNCLVSCNFSSPPTSRSICRQTIPHDDALVPELRVRAHYG